VTDPDPPNVARPDELLDGIGADAFEAFNAMQMTKQRHYALLSRLDEKRSRYGLSASDREQRMLDGLLADHDAQVKRFTRASAALKQRDAEANLALFGYIAAVAELEGDASGAVRH